MRILLISGEFPPMQGGVGDYTREMARAFAVQGHDVYVLAPSSVREAYRDARSLAWQVLPRIPNWRFRSWSRVIAAIRETRPDAIDVQYQAAAYDMRVPAIQLLPWRLRWLRERPALVVTYHDLKPPYLFPKAGDLRDWTVRQLCRFSDAAIVTNAEDWAVASGWPFVRPDPNGKTATDDPPASHPRLYQIPIGSNIPVSPPPGYDRAAWRARRGYSRDDFVWAYFGFLNESKGGETLIRALARTPKARLLMIGGRTGASDASNERYAAHIERLIEDLAVTDRVQWTGFTSAEEVSAALLGADVLVLPYRDGISFRRGSLHAALAHGCAVLSTTPRVPLPELENGGNVLLVPADDPMALSEGAMRLAHDPDLRRRLGEGATRLARRFTWDHIARETVDRVFAPLLAAQEWGHQV